MCVKFPGAVGQRPVGELLAVPAQLNGAIQVELHHDGILRPERHRLLREQLEPLIATAQRPVGAQRAREAHAEDARHVVRAQQGAMRIG